MKQHFFLRGAYCGSSPRREIFSHGGLCKPYGVVYVCPICSELWFSAPIDGCKSYAELIVCDRHKLGDHFVSQYFDHPGQLLARDDLADMLLDHLPASLLERELNLLLKEVEC
jgi:hypothetical protein